MIIGDRLRQIREQKNLSQGDIENKTGLMRCYVSRVENGHTVPSIETLEKLAKGLEVPLYQLFYDSEKPPELAVLPKRKQESVAEPSADGPQARVWNRLNTLLGRLDQGDRTLLLCMAQKMASKSKG